jgi:phosphatidylethanolamine/phosphatidyl-N-methylethanolamine N-methyltransferase
MENRPHKEQKFWDKFAGKYDSFIKNTVDSTYQTVISHMDSELNREQRVLEIGTGTGIISFSICTKVSAIIATDISPAMIGVAGQKQKEAGITNIDFQVQDSYHLTFPDASFDLVIASNLLHLLYEPEKPVKEVYRVLKENGIFIAPTFCVGENKKSRFITTVAGWFSGFKIINKWRIREFKHLLTAHGFIIDKAVQIDGRFPMAYVVMKKSNNK